MLKFRSAIVNELDEVMYWTDELTASEVVKIFDSHPEWKWKGIEIGDDYED